MGKVVKFIASPFAAVFGTKALLQVAAIAVNFIPGIGQLASLAITAALSIGQSLLTKPKSPGINQASTDRLNLSLIVNTPRVGVFGRTAFGTDLRDQEFTGTNKEYLHRFAVCAGHKVNSYQEIWFDDKLAWTSTGGVQGEFVGYLDVTPKLEGTPANVVNLGPRMGASRRYTGLAYVYFRFKLTGNSKKTESPFAAQVPTRITIIGEGMPCYDPRQDSTVPGGSGSHRANNQATWTYGAHARNPAVQFGTWMLGWRIQNPQNLTWKLSVGAGIPPSRIDWQSIIEGANLCDEPVTLVAGGTEPRYRGDGVFSEGSPTKTIEDFKACMNADVDDQDGLIRLTVFHNDLAAPDCDLSEADIEGDYEWLQTPSLDDSFNIVRGNYIEPASLYQPLPYKEISIAPPDGIDRSFAADYSFVQSKSQAERLSKQRAQRQQYGGTFRATFLATAWRTQKNGVVRLTFGPEGFVNKLFRVVETAVQQDGKVPMLLREENAQIYAWDNEEGPAVQLAAPTQYAPGFTPYAQFLGTVEEGATVGAPAGTNVAGVPAVTVVADTATALANSTTALATAAAAAADAADAVDAADGALASKLAAEAAAANAAADEALAEAHKNAAGSSASAAGASASSAAGSASTATTQASAAASSASVAAGHASTASTQAGVATSQAAAATAQASTATTQAGLSASYAANSLNALKANKPRGMSGGADYYTGSAGWAFGTDGSVPVINATGGSNMDVYPKWAYPAAPNRTFRIYVHARAATATRGVSIAYGDVSTDVNTLPTYTGPATGIMTFGTSYSVEYRDYTVPASPTSPFKFFFMVIMAGASQLFIKDFWVEDVTELVQATTQASIASAQAATATAQAAQAAASAVLSASLGFNSLNKNPAFADWPGGSGTIPSDWSDWINGWSNTKVTGDLGGFAYRATNTAGNNQGLASNPHAMYGKKTSGWFVMEADITVNSGNLQGVGLYIAKTGWTSTADNFMHFKDLINPATGVAYGAGILNYRYSFKKLIYIPEAGGTSDYGFYLMTAWGGFDPTIIAHDVTWHRASIKDATPQEVESKTVLAPLSATVSTQAAAIALLNGYTEARWVTTAVAGTGRAQLAIFATANGGGGVDIVGDVKIDGDLLVTGSVTSGELAANAATRGGISINDASVALTTSWQDAAEVTVDMIGGAAKIDFSAYIVGMGQGSGTNVQWRLLRNGTQIRIGTLMLFPGEQTVYGGSVGEYPYPVYTPVAGMFPAFFVDTSGATGSVTYKVQLKMTFASVSFADFAERTISVTEFRR